MLLGLHILNEEGSVDLLSLEGVDRLCLDFAVIRERSGEERRADVLMASRLFLARSNAVLFTRGKLDDRFPLSVTSAEYTSRGESDFVFSVLRLSSLSSVFPVCSPSLSSDVLVTGVCPDPLDSLSLGMDDPPDEEARLRSRDGRDGDSFVTEEALEFLLNGARHFSCITTYAHDVTILWG